jgi:hypothetical protein
MAGAERATRRALTLDRAHEGATATLANFLRLTGRSAEADELLQGILARNPAATMIRTSMAADMMLRQRPGDALALLDQPTPSDPLRRAHWRLQRSLALTQLGRTDEARIVLDALRAEPVPAALAPLVRWREVLLAAAPEVSATIRRCRCWTALGAERGPGVFGATRWMIGRGRAQCPRRWFTCSPRTGGDAMLPSTSIHSAACCKSMPMPPTRRSAGLAGRRGHPACLLSGACAATILRSAQERK